MSPLSWLKTLAPQSLVTRRVSEEKTVLPLRLANASGYHAKHASGKTFRALSKCHSASAFAAHLNRGWPALAGPNSNTVIHGQDEDLAVSNLTLLARLAAFGNRFDRRFDKLFVDRNLQLDFAAQIQSEILTFENLGVPLLPSKTLTVHDCQAENFDFGQRVLYALQFVGLNDCDD